MSLWQKVWGKEAKKRNGSPIPNHPIIYGIICVYLFITLLYSVVNPLFEAPDEQWHFFTADYIKENGRLPFVTVPHNPWTAQEAAQPPLYYVMGAILITPFDTSDAKSHLWLNPWATIGDASNLTNVNRIIHTEREDWPWRGYVAAAHVLRAFSAVLGIGTLWCIYRSARLLWPDEPYHALLATALPAFLPQFNFIHATISNDPMIIFLCSLALRQLLSLWSGEITSKRLFLLGLTIGLAALSKNAGVLLLPYAVGSLILIQVVARFDRTIPRFHVLSLGYLVLPALLLVIPLWWRNWVLYGDVTAVSVFVRVAGGDREYTIWQVLAESSGLWSSFFAIFGWFNIRASEWVYGVWNSMVGIAVIGCGIWIVKRWQTIRWHLIVSPLVLLAGWVVLVYTGLLMFMLQTEAAQGRLLFPALLPLVIIATAGISIVGQLLRRLPIHLSAYTFHTFFPMFAFVTTSYCGWWVIRPAYAKPPIVDELPVHATGLQMDMGQGLQLVGADVETETAEPGDLIWMTLYWQSQFPPSQTPAFKLELFGRELVVIARLHSYHGRGLYPANLWQPGQIIADRFAVRLEEEVAAPVLGRLFVRLADETISAEVGRVKVVPAVWPQPIEPPLAQLGEGVYLSAVSGLPTTAHPGDTIQLTTTWQVTAVPVTAYTTLFHLGSADKPPLATGDQPPLGGQYPTNVWAVGEVIEDSYQLTIPPDLPNGRYPLWLGMYDPITNTRLPLTINNQPQPNQVYLMGWVEVKR